MSLRAGFTLMAAALLLAACSGDDDDGPETPLSGERISVLTFEQSLEADPTIGDADIMLPPPYRNLNWPQPGGGPTKAMHHLEVGDRLAPLWRRNIGAGSTGNSRLVSQPIVVEGTVYAIDTEATVTALNARTGGQIWQTRIRVEDEKKAAAFGGGVAYGDGRIFVTTGYGVIVALDAVSGQEIWRRNLLIPFRGAPAYADGRVFAVTHDNQTFALAAADGAPLWDHVGIVETAGVMGQAVPAIAGDTVVVAYSSGEVVALRAENGRVTWSDTLSRTGRMTAMAALNDVDGNPVIDRGTVFATSHAGRMAAIDFATGNRVWENNIGSLSQPWIAGEYIFAITTENELVALLRRDGRVRWITQLQRFRKPKDREGPIAWVGPVLASDRLIIASSHGYVLSVSPYTGEILSAERLNEGTFVPPIVAGATLYVLTDNGQVVAYR